MKRDVLYLTSLTFLVLVTLYIGIALSETRPYVQVSLTVPALAIDVRYPPTPIPTPTPTREPRPTATKVSSTVPYCSAVGTIPKGTPVLCLIDPPIPPTPTPIPTCHSGLRPGDMCYKMH